MRNSCILFLTALIFSASGLAAYKVRVAEFGTLESIGSPVGGGPIALGGFSGLQFIGNEGDLFVFRTLTDRGPNAKKHDFDGDGVKDRPFLLPEFQPRIIEFTWNQKTGALKIVRQWSLSYGTGRPITGRPNVDCSLVAKACDESPVNVHGQRISFDAHGVDTEGITTDDQKNTWIVEEYGPSILRLNSEMQVDARFVPRVDGAKSRRYGAGRLPNVLTQRKKNRGFEAVVWHEGHLYVFLQSPLQVGKKSKNVRIVRFNTETLKVDAMFLYELESPKGKLGGVDVTPSGDFLLIEQLSRTQADTIKNIYRLSLGGATNLMVLPQDLQSRLESTSRAQLEEQGVRFATKKLEVNMAAMGLYNIEKFEGVAVIDETRFAVINDNDFGVAHRIDPVTKKLNPNSLEVVQGLFVFSKEKP